MSYFVSEKISDGVTPTIFATVKPASTAAIATDTALVVAISPNSAAVTFASPQHIIVDSGTITAITSITNPVAVTGTFFQATQPVSITTLGQQLAAASVPVVLTAAQLATLTPPTSIAVTNFPASQVVTLVSTTITGTVAENLTQVAGVVLGATAVTNFGTAPAAAAVPGVNASIFAGTTGITATGTSLNTNITAGTITAVTAITNALPTGANIIGKVDILGNAGAILDAPITAVTAPANGLAVLSVYNTTAPSLTTGQSIAQQADYAGGVFVKPFRRSQTVGQATTIASTLTTTNVLSAQAAGIFADISSLIITVTPLAGALADIAFTATLSDGTKSYIFDLDTGATGSVTVSGNGPTNLVATFNPPIPATTAATQWTIALSVNTVTVHVTVVAVLQKDS